MKFFKGKLARHGIKVIFNPDQILYIENFENENDLSALRVTLVAPEIVVCDIEEPEKLLEYVLKKKM